MANNVQAVRSYTFSHRDKLFLDANVWLYLFGPRQPRNYWNQIYSQVFNHILNTNSQIYIDVLVVSEFINAYARIKQRLVMGYCSKIESGFTTLSMNKLLADYISGDFDFNDQVITEICKNNGFTLITNDGDFRTQEIPILTANPSLLTT